MKRFRFRLEKVLQYRLMLKDDRKRELMLEIKRLNETQSRLERLRMAELANESALQAKSSAEVQLAGLYAFRLKAEIASTIEQIAQCEKSVEQARERYIEATKEAEVLEQLKKRKKEQYEQYVSKEEDKVLDELSVQSRTRLKRQGSAL